MFFYLDVEKCQRECLWLLKAEQDENTCLEAGQGAKYQS